MNVSHRLLPLVLALAFAGCSAHAAQTASSDGTKAADSTAAAAGTDTASAAAPDAPAGPLGGHLHLTGDVTLDRDFAVDQCVISPAGDGLLSGYVMGNKEDDALKMVRVTVKNYDKDGTYSPTDKTAEGQVAQAMTTGTMGPLTLMMVQPDSPVPLAFMLKPNSKLTIAISGDGAKGDAEFSDMWSPIPGEIADPSNPKSGGKTVSGSLTWTCKVERLNAKMNDAVNGMFKSIIK